MSPGFENSDGKSLVARNDRTFHATVGRLSLVKRKTMLSAPATYILYIVRCFAVTITVSFNVACGLTVMERERDR